MSIPKQDLLPFPRVTCDVCGTSFKGRPYWVLLDADAYGDARADVNVCGTTCLRAAPAKLSRERSA